MSIYFLLFLRVNMSKGDHPKTAEAIARKINLILGDTKETLSAKTGRPLEDIYEDEVQAVVVHGDDIDKLQGWQWDNSTLPLLRRMLILLLVSSLREAGNRICEDFAAA